MNQLLDRRIARTSGLSMEWNCVESFGVVEVEHRKSLTSSHPHEDLGALRQAGEGAGQRIL